MCGKSVQGSHLCPKCEQEVLGKQKSRRFLLTGITGIILAYIVLAVWREYTAKRSEVDFTIVSSFYDWSISRGIDILRSPFMFIPAVLILLIIAFLIGTKLTK
jgi:uncharacterized membrane protein